MNTHHPVIDLIEQRVSANHFDPARPLSDAQVTELARLAARAPSAYNLQNWRFVAVRSAEGKQRLKAAAYGQQKVVDAAVTFIVCGKLPSHEEHGRALQLSLDAGVLDRSVTDAWQGMAREAYGGNAEFQRDEAIRSASLAAMTLMLAAEGLGLVSGPMNGFDPEAVRRGFGLQPDEVPALLVAVGHVAPGNWPQKPRREVGELLRWA